MDMHEKLMKHYGSKEIQYSIISSLYNRELALIVPQWCPEDMKKRNIRTLKTHNVQGLKYILGRVNMEAQKTIYQFYYSLAKYENGIPNQDMTELKRDNTDWIKNHWKQMIKYDFVLDIDAGDWEDLELAITSMREIHAFLDSLEVPHEVVYSGKGFHIKIDGFFFNEYIRSIDTSYSERLINENLFFNPANRINVYSFYVKIARYFYREFSEMIDINIYDSRRLLKIPNTLAVYKDKIYPCFPLHTDEEINSFSHLSPQKAINQLPKESRVFNPHGNIIELMKVLKIFDEDISGVWL